jgi:hypothetical protein
MTQSIPVHLMKDRYWASMLHLFMKHPKLKDVLTTKYFDIEAEHVKIQSLKKNTSVWSHSEKIMLNLALHLFNERNKFNLSDLDYLDSWNKQLTKQ